MIWMGSKVAPGPVPMVPWYSGINGDAPVIAKAPQILAGHDDIEHWKDCLGGKMGENTHVFFIFIFPQSFNAKNMMV